MELMQIELFVLLAEHHNFSKVAEAYHISQSAVSKQISQLEYELGGKLFERDTRQVRLSKRGYAFLPYAKQVVLLIQEACTSVDAVNKSMEKKSSRSISMTRCFQAHFLPVTRKKYCSRFMY